MKNTDKFWQTKTLEELTPQEWEMLCDGCGRCCLVKLEDEDTGEIYDTSVSCHLFDSTTCRCKDYDNRFKKVPDCLDLDVSQVRKLTWLPNTCAYKLRLQGKPLPDWHPLKTGSSDSVHEAGISIKLATISEADVESERLGDFLCQWPDRVKSAD